jgi:hypothetical protein
MRYFFSLGILVVAAGLAACSCLAAEDGGETAKSAWRGAGQSPDWSTQISIGYLPLADIRDTPGDVGITDYRLKIAHNVALDDRLTLTFGGGYGLKHIDASSMVALPQDLHALFLDAGAAYRINDKSFASLKLTPGFYSDFKELGDDDLRMPALALGGYSFDNGVTVVGGFIYRFGYRARQFIPALGFSYQPDQYWRFDLVAPRPGITYFASRQLQLFVVGDFSSDEYELKDRSIGAKAISYSDYKAMAGFNYLPVPALKFSTSIGYAFDRRFVFYDSTRSDLRMNDVPFFKVSLDVGW